MGFEGRKKPPEFIIKAAMLEDAAVHRDISSKGGKASSRKQKAEKAARLEAERKAREALEEECAIFDEIDQEIIREGAWTHGLASLPPKENLDDN